MNRSDTWALFVITARTLGSPNGTGPGEVVSDKGHVIAESVDRRPRLLSLSCCSPLAGWLAFTREVHDTKGELIESHALSGEWTLQAAGAAVALS